MMLKRELIFRKINSAFKLTMFYVNAGLNTIYYFLIPKGKKIVINGFFNRFLGHTVKNNLGDDLNFYLISKLSNKIVFSATNLLVKTNNILFIGSILQAYMNEKSVVWGAGTIQNKININVKPKQIKAVRGPLTRNWLIKNDIKCPEIYSDPALLMPLFYMPQKVKKYRYGIIPHYIDWNDPNINRLISLLNDNVCLINMANYESIENVIDTINQCEYVLSSSLHGLILSDAYGIPNIWIEFSEKIAGNGFKFKDYFYSVNREIEDSVSLTKGVNKEDIISKLLKYNHPQINVLPILLNAPFDIPNNIIERAKEYYH